MGTVSLRAVGLVRCGREGVGHLALSALRVVLAISLARSLSSARVVLFLPAVNRRGALLARLVSTSPFVRGSLTIPTPLHTQALSWWACNGSPQLT